MIIEKFFVMYIDVWTLFNHFTRTLMRYMDSTQGQHIQGGAELNRDTIYSKALGVAHV